VHRAQRVNLFRPEPPDIPLFDKQPHFFNQVRGNFLKFLNRFKKRNMTSSRGSAKRKSVFTERGGRSIKTVQYQEGENTIAPLATVINSVFNGRFTIREKLFRIVKSDFVGWKRLERESITLVLLVDLSTSTFPFVRMFAEIINSLTAYFQMHKDRIGLISLQGTQACVMNHPTHNYRIVIKNLMALTIHGQSPLADGLQKALTMVDWSDTENQVHEAWSF